MRLEHTAQQPGTGPAVPCTHDIFARAQVGENRRRLKGSANPCLCDQVRTQGQWLSGEFNLAATVSDEPGQHIDGGRFAGSVGPDNAVDFTLFNLQREFIQGQHAAKGNADVPGLQYQAHGGPFFLCSVQFVRPSEAALFMPGPACHGETCVAKARAWKKFPEA